MTLAYLLVLIALGTGAGLLAGLLGIGGGMVMVPLLVMVFNWQGLPFDLVVHAAVATAMATILFTSLSSTLAHHRRGGVRWSVAWSMLPGIVLGGLLAGGVLFAVVPTGWLALFFGLFVGYSAWGMFRARPPKPTGQLPGRWGLGVAGTLIGAISGLLGAGGGFMTVPFLVRCRVVLTQAIGTSAALGFPIAAANTLGYVVSGWQVTASDPTMLGYVVWPALLAISIVSTLLAPVGASLAHRLPVAVLRRIFAMMLFSLAAYMLWTAYVAFVD